MNYELAKQLKDAGFKQPEGHENYRGLFKNSDNEIDSRFEEDAVYCPTLEELIEACGKDFRDLEQYSNTEEGKRVYKWQANAFKDPSSSNRYLDTFKGRGLTPTEAVAKLYLALNKK